MRDPEHGHEPVLPAESIELLAPGPGQTIVDCTLGRGGHASLIAERLGPTGTLLGFDADPRNLEFVEARLADAPCRLDLHHANFADLSLVLRRQKIPQVDAIFADLGISTNQLFDSEYGLSFQADMPLDMRLNPTQTSSAEDIVNKSSERDLADLLFHLADERFSRPIAKKIVEQRRVSPITTTARLAAVVRSALPVRGGAADRIDPATRTFLALRMAVNKELDNLTNLIRQGLPALKPGGRLAIISFHSGEDRVVKNAFREAEQTGRVRLLTKKPVVPSDMEVDRNPRSRSAKLRAVSTFDGRSDGGGT